MEKSIAKLIQGTVTSDKMSKTIVVELSRMVRHKLYKKYIKKTTTYHVHDENELAKLGDVVLIQACRPYSKSKKWELVKVVGGQAN